MSDDWAYPVYMDYNWTYDAEIAWVGEDDRGALSDIEYYPGGEPMIKTRPEPGVRRVLVRPKSMGSFVAAMFFLDALRHRHGDVPELILPYVPGARQDRLNDEGDYLFTAKSVAEMINDRYLPKVTIVDPHSDVTPALIERCRVIPAVDALHANSPTLSYDVVIAPDGGAEKRAGLVAKRLGIPLLHAWKSRSIRTGEITKFGIEDCSEYDRFLMVDDICDGGGTFFGLRQAMHPMRDSKPAHVDLYVTHGVFSRGTDLFAGMFDNVFCTDSIHGDKGSARVISICQRLLEKGML